MTDDIYNFAEELNAPAEDAYRSLMVNVQYCKTDRDIRTLAITSCIGGEGKTTTAVNLASSMARHGLKVLLVDADMRKPMLMKEFGYRGTKGLSNYLSGDYSLITVTETTNIPGFHFIPCGPVPSKPLKLIESQRFRDLIREAGEQYDLVIFDTPPLGSVIDSAVIAAQTDGTAIVIQSKSIEPQRVLRIKEQLEKVNANILGVILTKVRKDDYVKHCGYFGYYGSKKMSSRKLFKKLRKSRLRQNPSMT